MCTIKTNMTTKSSTHKRCTYFYITRVCKHLKIINLFLQCNIECLKRDYTHMSTRQLIFDLFDYQTKLIIAAINFVKSAQNRGNFHKM